MKPNYLLIVVVAITLLPVSAFSQNTKNVWSTFDMGYEAPASGNIIVKSLVGQLFVGGSSQSTTYATSGFLAHPLLGTVVGVEEDKPGIPLTYALRQNYPNPFNPSTTISFDLPKTTTVSLKVYNLLGQETATILNKEMTPGTHEITFDASALPSGVYFCRISAGTYIATRKLMLMK